MTTKYQEKDYKDRIKELREDKDLKQYQLAELLNTSQSNYSKYERGDRALTIEQLIKICKFYNISADYILGLGKKMPWPEENKEKK